MDMTQLNRLLIEVERLIAADGDTAREHGLLLLRDLIATSEPRPAPELRCVGGTDRFDDGPG